MAKESKAYLKHKIKGINSQQNWNFILVFICIIILTFYLNFIVLIALVVCVVRAFTLSEKRKDIESDLEFLSKRKN